MKLIVMKLMIYKRICDILRSGLCKQQVQNRILQNDHCKHYSSSRWDLEKIRELILRKDTEKIVVMAGAGISTPSGLIDFRSPGTGLYSKLQKYNLPYAEAIFDIDYFKMDQRPFFALAKELYPGNFAPNVSHYFVRLLQEKEKLLRMYTQNIDGLERLAGVRPDLLVEAHGSFSTATCTYCGEHYDGDKIKDIIFKDEIPKCTIPKCKGVIKPDIVFFGEQLPMRFWSHVNDMAQTNLLIIMGTSLEVEPFASIAELVSNTTPRLLINRELVGSFHLKEDRDVVIIGDIVEGIQTLVKSLGWTDEMNHLMAMLQKSKAAKSKTTPDTV